MEGYGGVKCVERRGVERSVERSVVTVRKRKRIAKTKTTRVLHLNTKKKELRSERSEARTNLPLTSTRSTRLDCS